MPVSEEIRTKLNKEQPIYALSSSTLKRNKTKKLKSQQDTRASPTKAPVVVTISSSDSTQDMSHAKRRYEWETGIYNLLLNPQVLNDEPTQALFTVLLVCLAIIYSNNATSYKSKSPLCKSSFRPQMVLELLWFWFSLELKVGVSVSVRNYSFELGFTFSRLMPE